PSLVSRTPPAPSPTGGVPCWDWVGGGGGACGPVGEEDPPPHPASARVAPSRAAASLRRLSLPRRPARLLLPAIRDHLAAAGDAAVRWLGRDRGHELALHGAAVGRDGP